MAMPASSVIKFCSACGSDRVELRVPDGDTLPRYVCAACGTIHYQNPKVVVGCLPEWEEQVLLCRRAIEPRHGLWTLPAGFLENGETVVAGAVRETLEEANARVVVGDLYTMISLPQISQIYMMFRARLVDLDFGPGPESLEVRLFREDEIPWEEMAFRTIGADAAQLLSRSQARDLPDARQRARAEGAAAGPVRRGVTRRRRRSSRIGGVPGETPSRRPDAAKRHPRNSSGGFDANTAYTLHAARRSRGRGFRAGAARRSRSSRTGSRSRPAAPAASTTRWAAGWPTSCRSTFPACRRPPK